MHKANESLGHFAANESSLGNPFAQISPTIPTIPTCEQDAEESTPSTYFKKFLGANAKPLPAASPPLAQTWCSFLGAFLGIGSLEMLVEWSAGSCQGLGTGKDL